MVITVLLFFLILTVLVLVHELGHFVVAKKLGIKVEEFGFGFPPRIFGIQKGETLYSINALPIGGFVKLYGEDEAGGGKIQISREAGSRFARQNYDLERAFFARPVGQRAAVVIAGVVMNALLAIVIFYAYLGISHFKTQLPLFGDYRFFGVNQQNTSEIIVGKVAKNSPAEKAGITALSKIVSLNDQTIQSVDDLVQTIKKYKGKEVVVVWKDSANRQHKALVVPRVSPPKNEGALGISFFPADTAVLTYQTPVQKAFSGIVHPLNLMFYNFNVMGKLIGVSIKEKTVAPVGEGVSGPVGIASLVGTIVHIPDVKERILQILNLSGILSISLAFFNVLPIPALDGGRLFFILIEAVIRKPVPKRFEEKAHQIGFAILISLILLITFKDISNLFK